MTGPVEVLMPDGAIKRQGDNLAPQNMVMCAYASTGGAFRPTDAPLVPMDAVEFAPPGWYDIAARRFTPKIAGYYRLDWIVTQGSWNNLNDLWQSRLYKNGVDYAHGEMGHDRDVTANDWWRRASSGGSKIVYMNGTTDYLEMHVYGTYSGDAVRSVQSGREFTRWEAELIGVTVGVMSEPHKVVGTDLSWRNGWTNQTGYPVKFFKDPNGIVHLQGAVNGAAATAEYCFTLPPGYRPGIQLGFPMQYWVPSAYYLGDFLIAPDGQSRAYNNADAFSTNISYGHLSHISFRAEN